jgi:hypothetical protein
MPAQTVREAAHAAAGDCGAVSGQILPNPSSVSRAKKTREKALFHIGCGTCERSAGAPRDFAGDCLDGRADHLQNEALAF